MSNVTELEEFKASKLPKFRLGTLEVQGQRVRLVCDASLTAGAARTMSAQLLVLADSIEPKREGLFFCQPEDKCSRDGNPATVEVCGCDESKAWKERALKAEAELREAIGAIEAAVLGDG